MNAYIGNASSFLHINGVELIFSFDKGRNGKLDLLKHLAVMDRYKPHSAKIESPGNSFLKMPQISSYLSEVLPPHAFETKEIVP